MERLSSSGTTLKVLKKYGIVVALVAIMVVFTVIDPRFLTASNMLNMLRQISYKGIVSIGMVFVILTGGIDLSVGSIATLSGVVIGLILKAGYGTPLAIMGGLVVGLLCGLLNGFFVANRRMPPFIVTLATSLILRGVVYVITEGKPISGLPEDFLEIGKGTFLGVPIPVWILLVVLLIAYFILDHTTVGRHIYAVGGNERTAYVSGISIVKTRMFAYVMSGVLCGLAAVVVTARVSSALSTAGTGYENNAIASAVIGGVSLVGGKGSLAGALIGILIMGAISNGMDIIGVTSYYQNIVMGIIILIAVQIDLFSNKD